MSIWYFLLNINRAFTFNDWTKRFCSHCLGHRFWIKIWVCQRVGLKNRTKQEGFRLLYPNSGPCPSSYCTESKFHCFICIWLQDWSFCRFLYRKHTSQLCRLFAHSSRCIFSIAHHNVLGLKLRPNHFIHWLQETTSFINKNIFSKALVHHNSFLQSTWKNKKVQPTCRNILIFNCKYSTLT